MAATLGDERRACCRGAHPVPGTARAPGDRGHRPGEPARAVAWHRAAAAAAVLERSQPRLQTGRAVHAALAVPDRAAGGQPPGGPDRVPGSGHADRGVVPAGPAQRRAAGLGGASSAAAGGCGRGGLMPVSDLHRQVAAVALAAAREHGFALGGGNALLAHGVISRPTQDVDLFTDQEHGVPAAAGTVEAALRGAGFQAEQPDQTGGLSDMFPDIGEGLAEWIVTTAGGEQLLLQLAYFERDRDPVVMDLGPVLHLEDAVGGKVSALASRAEPRGYADGAAAMDCSSMA